MRADILLWRRSTILLWLWIIASEPLFFGAFVWYTQMPAAITVSLKGINIIGWVSSSRSSRPTHITVQYWLPFPLVKLQNILVGLNIWCYSHSISLCCDSILSRTTIPLARRLCSGEALIRLQCSPPVIHFHLARSTTLPTSHISHSHQQACSNEQLLAKQPAKRQTRSTYQSTLECGSSA